MEPVGTLKIYSVDESFAPLEETHTDHVMGRLKLMRTDAGIWVNGTLEASVHCACSRCLREFMAPAQLQVDDVYYPMLDVDTGARLPIPEDGEVSCIINTDHILDITEAVRQYAMLGLPMMPLCQSNCAGLCPECGANLNEKNCSCEARGVDPRWLPLLSLGFASHSESQRS